MKNNSRYLELLAESIMSTITLLSEKNAVLPGESSDAYSIRMQANKARGLAARNAPDPKGAGIVAAQASAKDRGGRANPKGHVGRRGKKGIDRSGVSLPKSAKVSIGARQRMNAQKSKFAAERHKPPADDVS